MNKNELDYRIDRLAARVHSPKGQFADREALYAELKRRLRPSEARVVPMRRPFMQRFGRWGIAASLLLVVTLGIAGVAAYRWSMEADGASATNTAEVQPVTDGASATKMKFERTPLAEIAQQLSVAYKVRIVVADDELARFQVTATFSTDEPLEDVLTMLCMAAKCHWQRTGEGYVIGR